MARPEHLAELDRRARARFEEAATVLRSNLEARLREVSEQLFAAVAEARAELPEAWIDPEALEALDAEPRREGEQAALGALLESSIAFDRAATQGAVLEALLAGARRFAPRAALLLTREEGWLGWGGAGFESAADPIAGRDGRYDGEALAKLAAGRGVVEAANASAAELAATLGLPPAEQGYLVPLVLRDRIAAALYVDREAGEAAPPLAALQLLTAAAASRLELQPLSSRASTPTLTSADASAEGLRIWSADAATAPASPEAAAAGPDPDGFTLVADEEETPAGGDEVAASTALEEESELESTDISALFREPAQEVEAYEPAPLEAPAPNPEAETAVEATPVDAEVEVEAGEATSDLAAEFVPVEEESPLMPRERVFEIAPEAAAEPIELAADASTAAEPESAGGAGASEPEWRSTEGEATAYLGTYAPATPAEPAPPEAEVGDTTGPVAPIDEPDLSETRAIPTGRVAPPQSTPSPAATVAFEAPRPATAAASADASEDATVMIDRTQDSTVMIDRTQDSTVLMDRSAAAPPAPAPPAPAPPAPPAAEEEEDPNERTAARGGRTTEVAPPPDVRGPGLAFTSTRGARATGENALHDEARRLARLLISEIKLYNEEQVDEGRRNRDLYHRLKEDIDRSRQIYEERVHDSVRESSDYFQQELVRSLAGGDVRVLGV